MMGKDVRFAFRMFLRNPGSTAAAVVTLALAIGAVTAVFSVVNGVLLDPLPYEDPGRVVMVGETDPAGGFSAISWENYRDWAESDVLGSVALYLGNSVSVIGDGQPERIRGLFVTSSYFDVTQVRPVLGRAILPGEDEPGGPRAAVLSWGWWQERFGADPEVIGRTIRLNNEPHTVVGVMPRSHRSPFDTPSAWISFHTAPRTLDRGSRSLLAIARLAEGDDLASARTRLEGLAAGLAERHPDTNQGRSAWILSLEEWVSGPQRPLLYGLLGSVVVLLLIAAANVAGLQIARTEARTRELAVRRAMGGERWRLARQLLIESGLLAAAGGLAGLGLAYAGVAGLEALDPRLALFFDVGVDGRVLMAGMAVTVLTAVGFGVFPALSAARAEPGEVLARGGRSAGSRRGSRRVRAALVAVQVALSLTLLVSAGLLVRTLRALGQVDPGFETENLLTLEFRLPENRYDTDERIVAFFDAAVERVGALPGVEAVTAAQHIPFGDRETIPFVPEGTEPDLERAPRVEYGTVMPGYVDVMGMRLVRGRSLDPSAAPDEPVEALVSERVARELLGDGDALGRAFYISEDLDVARVVGVVSDVSLSLTDGPVRSVYVNQRQRPDDFASLAVRTRGDPMGAADAVRQAILSVDPDQPVWEVMPITDRMRATLGDRRFAMTLLSVFGALAAVLAAVGIYGVMSYHVGVRTRELGLRMALGAGRGAVLGMVLRQGAVLVGIGLLGGLVLAWLGASLLENLLFGVPMRDPVTFGGATLLLTSVAFVAAWMPARRAIRLDPARTLQEA